MCPVCSQIGPHDYMNVSKAGTLTFRANQSHGTSANMVLLDTYGASTMYLFAVKSASPGEEVLWDYGTHSNKKPRGKGAEEPEPESEDLDSRCICQGQERTRVHVWKDFFVEMRRCPALRANTVF